MRNALWSVEDEPEVSGRRGHTAFDHLRCGQRAKRVVDLNRGEFRAVELEEAFRRRARWIKLRLPCRIGPAGSSSVKTLRRCGRRKLGDAGQGWPQCDRI